ncbi:MAG: helix-turn-helix domain-containing protein, partial [Candidatus Stygibacter frigidus]|nr:helix-turn-helix domain-containing protein [Candidatus Stygibacter frigidus]
MTDTQEKSAISISQEQGIDSSTSTIHNIPLYNSDHIPDPPDSDSPSGHIFIAATRLFSEFGFKGTSTRAIAHAAGVKQVMLHYYFGSKTLLYEAVLKYEGMTMLEVIFGNNPK